jgi:3-keto-5-aminohexanoate cleavage enzyme
MSAPTAATGVNVSDKLIVSAAVVGSWPTKAQNPAVPITVEEIAEAALGAAAAGAAIVHIHVRDDAGKVTCDPARYAQVRDLIRARGCDVVINMSTGGGAGLTTDEQRMEPVALRPEIASFDCGSLNFGQRVFVNSPDFLAELAARMERYGVLPEI